MSACPVPGCPTPAPDGPNAVFCVDHYFLVPRAYSGLIYKTKIACARCQDEDDKRHLQEQLQSYIQSAIRLLPKEGPNGA